MATNNHERTTNNTEVRVGELMMGTGIQPSQAKTQRLPFKVDLLYGDESFRIKAACMEVSKALGDGFLEKVYENALLYELREAGFKVDQQAPLSVFYKDTVVGEYFADLIVDDKIVIEVKSCRGLEDAHRAQLINYLRGTRMRLGLLVNFGQKYFEFERLVV